MNGLRQTLLSLLLFCSAGAAPAHGSADPLTRRVEQQLDMRSNPTVVRDHRAPDMADAVSESELLMVAILMSANPDVWLNAMEHASQPGTFRNFSQLADPQVLVDWFYASIDPQFQQAILSRALDPKKSKRWMQTMSDPRFYMPALAIINRATPMQWMKVTADGRVIQPLQARMNSETHLDWTRLPTLSSFASANLPSQRY